IATHPGANSSDLRYDSGRVYLTNGTILDADSAAQVGVFSVSATQQAIGPVAPDSSVGRAFVLISSTYNFIPSEIIPYDLATFVPLSPHIPIATVPTAYPTNPASLIRWGQDGLAYRSQGQVFILRSRAVKDLSSSSADLSVSTSMPAAAATGSILTFT